MTALTRPVGTGALMRAGAPGGTVCPDAVAPFLRGAGGSTERRLPAMGSYLVLPGHPAWLRP
jgi:hypothetical protein